MHPFLTDYANWDALSTICLTVDIDWAPEYMIEQLLGMFDDAGVSATLFATHSSDALLGIRDHERYELGLHPNLSANSTQGKGLEDIVEGLLGCYGPCAGNRFHLLKYSYRDLMSLTAHGIKYDVSTFLFNAPCALPVYHDDIGLVMLTYTWEDGPAELTGAPMTLDSISLDTPGIKIANFHPLNVFLNGSGSQNRLRFLSEIESPSTRRSTFAAYLGAAGVAPAPSAALRQRSNGSRWVRVRAANPAGGVIKRA